MNRPAIQADPAQAVLRFTDLPNGWLIGQFDPLLSLGIPNMVTTMVGPDPADARHRTRVVAGQLASILGLSDAAFLRQVHGNKVLATGRGGLVGQADGLCTTTKGLALVAKSGDCPIILVAETALRAVGFAHASWRSTVAGVVANLVHRLVEMGCRPQELVACICPSIGPDCYTVGHEVRQMAIEQIGPHAAGFFRSTQTGLYFDLWAANADALVRSGVNVVHRAGICSACNRHLFPSHRRDGPAAGRFLVAIGLPTPPPDNTRSQGDQRIKLTALARKSLAC